MFSRIKLNKLIDDIINAKLLINYEVIYTPIKLLKYKIILT